jgi:hypothetical protein
MYDGVDRHDDLSSSPGSHSDSSFDDMHPHQRMFLAPRIVNPEMVLTANPVSGRYFSFPSFDLYEGSQPDEEKSEAKSP